MTVNVNSGNCRQPVRLAIVQPRVERSEPPWVIPRTISESTLWLKTKSPDLRDFVFARRE